jgi:2Fe-2S ferredoxin
MPKVTFITADKTTVEVPDSSGNLMEIALENDIAGIGGDCGGVCSCSTCHVYVRKDWIERVGLPDSVEKDTLEFNSHYQPNSRLGCQVEMSDDLDGLVVEVAPAE